MRRKARARQKGRGEPINAEAWQRQRQKAGMVPGVKVQGEISFVKKNMFR